MSGRSVLALALLALLPASHADAQGPQSVIADPDGLNRAVMDRAELRRICWERSEPRASDWVSERDAGYRREVMSRYLLEKTETGWRWLPMELATRTDVRASDRPEGYTDRVLEVSVRDPDRGRARLRVDGPLSAGEVEMDWSVPPERLCMADELDLEARARVTGGTPGAHGLLFILPLTREMLEAEGADVKACSPTDETLVDREAGIGEAVGRCVRPLSHLRPGMPWEIWVKLPESFYVVYPYEPRSRR